MSSEAVKILLSSENISKKTKPGSLLRRLTRRWVLPMMLTGGFFSVFSCSNEAPPMCSFDVPRDSLPVMVVNGVSKMISDSGLMRYRIIAEEWEVYDKTKPPRQEFKKGIFLERFNQNFDMDMYIIADTAWCFDQNLWRLKGNVYMLDKVSRTTFITQELFWNMKEHRFYSNRYMKIQKPDREIEGDRFTANEQLTQYRVWKSKGYMPMPKDKDTAPAAPAPADTARTR